MITVTFSIDTYGLVFLFGTFFVGCWTTYWIVHDLNGGS